MNPKLFAVYLGGTAPKANIELHDVVFVTGYSIENTYDQLLDKWFGSPKGLHLDSWVELDVIDGFKVTLQKERSQNNKKLYFINFGSYRNGIFAEFHVNKFLVAESVAEIKIPGKREISEQFDTSIHTDDLYELDECLEISNVDEYHISLEPTIEPTKFVPKNGYNIVPKNIIADFIARHPSQDFEPTHLNKVKW